MFKNRKRLRNGVFVSKAPCSSAGVRDNVVDMPSDRIPSSPTPSKPTNFDNLSEVFADCGMDIDADTSNILRNYLVAQQHPNDIIESPVIIDFFYRN